MTTKPILASLSLCVASSSFGAIVAFHEEFDGNTNDYNPNSTTATAAGEWVDFNNRMTSDSYTIASGGSETVLAGTSNGNDPQIRSDFGFGIDKTLVESFTLRIRVDKDQDSTYNDSLANGDFNVFWGSAAYGSPGAANTQSVHNLQNPTTLVAESDGWHVATWTIPAGGLTAGANPNVESIRIDPANGAAGDGDTFEIDYFRISVVPEPSSLSLVALGALAACSRRRRRS